MRNVLRYYEYKKRTMKREMRWVVKTRRETPAPRERVAKRKRNRNRNRKQTHPKATIKKI